ncbi:phosphatidate cytidylyltransferase [Chitinilyticum piscinae]|uniref:Phosphatidate cytidylyltransferase n=1 Tax=Chitinilyticum piscinae TaxID=2866724 RepID=A0A8J7KAR9_9NEIS|nr:phosphatidate cytidylyltransferase [Chitinilyticum piscinae]MBE9609394.1 phosphatidate cytidylyltransferase [Chitinilyticum piscinae]
MLKTRILTVLVLLPVFFGALFWLPSAPWQLLCALLAGLAAWEWARLAGFTGIVRAAYPGLTALIAALLIRFQPGMAMMAAMLIAASLFWLLLAPVWLRFKWQLRNAGLMNVLLGWSLLLPATLVLALFRDNPWQMLAVLAIAWVADSAAYFSGKAFGRHKLAPSISPGKSWEGVLGAAVAVISYVLLLPGKPLLFPVSEHFVTPVAQILLWIVVAVLLLAVSVIGDLLESLYKRQAGMKDSSNLLPGHGGVLDRIDSLLAMLPVAFAILVLSFLLSLPS